MAGFYIAGVLLLVTFSVTICDAVKHYVDGGTFRITLTVSCILWTDILPVFFSTLAFLFAVMMVYKYWDCKLFIPPHHDCRRHILITYLSSYYQGRPWILSWFQASCMGRQRSPPCRTSLLFLSLDFPLQTDFLPLTIVERYGILRRRCPISIPRRRWIPRWRIQW